MFNATFNNISVLSWPSVLLLEDTKLYRVMFKVISFHLKKMVVIKILLYQKWNLVNINPYSVKFWKDGKTRKLNVSVWSSCIYLRKTNSFNLSKSHILQNSILEFRNKICHKYVILKIKKVIYSRYIFRDTCN